jgi:hypothetical protein
MFASQPSRHHRALGAGRLEVGADLAEGAVELAGRALRELALVVLRQEGERDDEERGLLGVGAQPAAGVAHHVGETRRGDELGQGVERPVAQLGEAGIAAGGGARAPGQAGEHGRADVGQGRHGGQGRQQQAAGGRDDPPGPGAARGMVDSIR